MRRLTALIAALAAPALAAVLIAVPAQAAGPGTTTWGGAEASVIWWGPASPAGSQA